MKLPCPSRPKAIHLSREPLFLFQLSHLDVALSLIVQLSEQILISADYKLGESKDIVIILGFQEGSYCKKLGSKK